MISTSKAALDAMHPKGTLSGLRPSGARRLRAAARRCQEQAARHALPVGGRKPRVVVGCPCWRG
jgi:hypothetical protein